jgi:hypothetical protein
MSLSTSRSSVVLHALSHVTVHLAIVSRVTCYQPQCQCIHLANIFSVVAARTASVLETDDKRPASMSVYRVPGHSSLTHPASPGTSGDSRRAQKNPDGHNLCRFCRCEITSYVNLFSDQTSSPFRYSEKKTKQTKPTSTNCRLPNTT